MMGYRKGGAYGDNEVNDGVDERLVSSVPLLLLCSHSAVFKFRFYKEKIRKKIIPFCLSRKVLPSEL